MNRPAPRPPRLADRIPDVQADLHALARRLIARRRPPGSLRATSLVHETYIRVRGSEHEAPPDRDQVLRISARAMRRVLIDHARRAWAARRDARRTVALGEREVEATAPRPELLRVDAALRKLARIDARKASVVELRFYGGCELDETARLLGVSRATVVRDWSFARAWLSRELRRELDG